MKSILIIEDNDLILTNIGEVLELSGYKVILAGNGKVGVELAIKHHPDLIICDVMMPVLDGYGVLHALHKNKTTKNTPFIFLTAKTERSDFRKGMELGADDYITKPFSATELLNAVDSRLKKIDMLKEDLSQGLEGVDRLMQLSGSKTIADNRNISRYKKKQVIYAEGNHASNLYYVLKGKVKLYKSNDEGKELVTDLYVTGDFFGYVALLEQTNYKDTAQAMEETELAVIPKDDFDYLVNNNKEVASQFIKLLASNISEKENLLINIAYNSLRKKVANALVALQLKYRTLKEDELIIKINRESLANIAGTAKESLIRTLRDFNAEKLIDIKSDGSIVIVNQHNLEHLRN
jgi:DNA-binding response OmpR family regulator